MFIKFLFPVVLLVSASSLHAEDISSYQEEYIFLKNQLSSLQKRKTKSLGQLKELEAKLQSKIQKLSADVSSAESRNEVLKSKLSTFDENRTDEERNVKKADVIKSQMTDFVTKQGQEKESLVELNKFILSYLNNGAREFSSKGTAYNKKGIKEDGEIYALGHVASYFVKGEDYIPLATNSSKTGLVFTDHSVPKKEMLNFDGSIKNIAVSFKDGELVQEKSLGLVLREKFEAGGAVGYVIVLLGLFGVAVALIRYNLISGYTSFDEAEISEVVSYIQKGNLESAKKSLYAQRTNPLNQFVDLLLSCRHKTDEVYEAIVVGEISKIQSKVSKYGPYLLVLAAVAPLLGLLGTVTGMIGTFDMITVHGTGNPKILSGGIKEALVTTQMGLIVAIPCILVGNYLSSKALKIVNKFEEVASVIPKG